MVVVVTFVFFRLLVGLVVAVGVGALGEFGFVGDEEAGEVPFGGGLGDDFLVMGGVLGAGADQVELEGVDQG